MTSTTTTPLPDIPLPAGALEADHWQPDGPQPSYRVVFGAGREITDHDAVVSTSAIQWADGSIDDGRIEAPGIAILTGNAETDIDSLNSDQARELAAVLLEAAAELDGWATR